jgi:hypothetical protein
MNKTTRRQTTVSVGTAQRPAFALPPLLLQDGSAGRLLGSNESHG